MRDIGGVVVALLVAFTPSAMAQEGFAFGAAVLATNENGGDFAGIGTGVGGDVTVRKAGARWSWGAGATWLSYPVTGQAEHMRNLGLFIEGRYQLADRGTSRFAPYLLGRAAVVYSRLKLGEVRSRRDGWSLGLGAGSLIRAVGPLDLDLSVTLSYVRMGNLHVDLGARRNTGINGSSITLRGGILLW